MRMTAALERSSTQPHLRVVFWGYSMLWLKTCLEGFAFVCIVVEVERRSAFHWLVCASTLSRLHDRNAWRNLASAQFGRSIARPV